MCRVRWAVLGMFVVSLVAVVPGASAAGRKPVVHTISRLYSQTAPAGSLLPVKGTANRYVLRLVGVSNQVVWFSDRPARGTGVIPTRGFGRAWKSFGFVADPPNAVLTLLGGDAEQDTIVLKLGQPHYDRRRHTISYPVTRLGHATGNLAHYEASQDGRVPHRFADASLFIDDASAPVVNGCVIAEYTSCPGADLSGTDLSGDDLSGADLWAANFSGANLTNTNFQAAGIVGANFTNANLTGTLLNTDLTAANFTGSNLSAANLFGAQFCSTTMPDGTSNIRDCNVESGGG